jgi:hypothetical protein
MPRETHVPTVKPIIKGTKLMVKKKTRVRFDPSQGKSISVEYESAGTECREHTAALERAGIAYDLEETGVRSSLVTTEASNPFGDDESVARWELMTNQQMHDVRTHWRSIALGKTLVGRVMKDVDRHERGQTVDTDAYGNATAAQLFRLIAEGGLQQLAFQWVLRYTATVPNTWILFPVDNAGLGAIYTTAELSPPGLVGSIVNSISAPEANDDVIWGWMKVAVNYGTTTRGRVDVSAEFWLAQWPEYVWG